MNKKRTRTLPILSLVTLVYPLFGMTGVHAQPSEGAAIAQQGDAAAGVLPCSTCHGQSGEGVTSVGPRLAGLSKTYILNQLTAFRMGVRKNAVMQPIASTLTAARADEVADYFATAKAISQPVPMPADTAAKGKELAEHGRWGDGLPACENCHAPNGVGVASDFPYIAGQQTDYIEQQIKNWRTGVRAGDPLNLMRTVASKLRDDDIAIVAAYFASLPAPERQGEGR